MTELQALATRRVVVSGALGLLGLSLLTSPMVGIGLVLLACAAYFIARQPDVALVAFFALVPFHVLAFSVLNGRFEVDLGPMVYWKEALLLALLARGILMRLQERDTFRDIWRPANQLLICFVLVLVLWATMSPFPAPAVNSFVRTAEGPIMLLTILVLRPPRKVIYACVAAMLATAAIMAPAAVIELLGPKNGFQTWYGHTSFSEVFYADPFARSGYRAGSFFGDSLVLAFWLSGMTSVAVGGFLMARGRLKIAAGIVVGLCVAGTVTTYTRSAYVAVPLGVLVTLALAVEKRKVRIAALCLVFTAGVSVAGLLALNGSGSLTHSDSNNAHFSLLRGAFSQSAAHPLGFGLGTTDFVAHRYKIQGYVGQSVDSIYGDRLVEGGPIVLILYVLSLVSIGVRLIRGRALALFNGDRRAAILAGAALGAFVAIAAAGTFLPVQEQPVTLTAWGSAGLALAAVAASGRAPSVRESADELVAV